MYGIACDKMGRMTVVTLEHVRTSRRAELAGRWIVAVVRCSACGHEGDVHVVPAERQYGLECRNCRALEAEVVACWYKPTVHVCSVSELSVKPKTTPAES